CPCRPWGKTKSLSRQTTRYQCQQLPRHSDCHLSCWPRSSCRYTHPRSTILSKLPFRFWRPCSLRGYSDQPWELWSLKKLEATSIVSAGCPDHRPIKHLLCFSGELISPPPALRPLF